MFHKSCPRCNHGDLLFDSDDQLVCLQCGYELRPVEKLTLLSRLTMARRKVRSESAA